MPGKITRGKTAPGRLRALDRWLCRQEAPLLRQDQGLWADAAFVDVGFGAQPSTTLEAAASFAPLNPRLRTVGVELDPERVQAAQAHRGERIHFVQGGFAPPPAPRARLVRAMNVLRQYSPWDIAQAHQQMGEPLLVGGLLVEGTCDKRGDRMAVHLLRKHSQGLRREGLLLYTSFAHGFAPMQLRDYLPRDLRREVVPGSPMGRFFADWVQAWEQVRHGQTPQASFQDAALALASLRAGICTQAWMLEGGYLLWTPPQGVPQGASGASSPVESWKG